MMVEMDYAKKMQKCHEYVEALEQEQKKIQVFQRELPFCLELVTQAIEACRKELSGTTISEQQCSEQTTSVCGGPVFEEFIPIKKRSLSQEDEEDEEEDEHESSPELEQTNKKSDWLRSVQLWNPSPDLNPKEERVVKRAKVVEVKPKSGAFQPFQKEKKRVLETDLQPAAVKVASSAPATTTSSTTETGGAKSDLDKVGEEQIQMTQQHQTQTHRKQRRCWSPELHRRFLNALQQLGGSHVATPKQIRDHMKVDGLTNDEVKSHLQKYRLHTRRPATTVAAQSNGNPQQPQFVVVGGIWVPSPQDFHPPSDAANNGGGVYAPVAVAAQSPKRSVERSCNSPGASSSTNTATTPVS
ncbi:PREDICTED: myb family transcription factor EFM-like [Camelina sativa]|uniref:Myb family transcription factor EFM-like n=1 Tax=Camelina sativa TaxID=90675 RepID=A0ABM0SSG7_CAMSA|nr:PREDICTED: myb family transcription factor EFM-like [Camelina sativa]